MLKAVMERIMKSNILISIHTYFYKNKQTTMLKVVIRRKGNGGYTHYVRKVNEMKEKGIYYLDCKLFYYDGHQILKEYNSLNDTYNDISKLIRIKKLEYLTKTIK